MFLPRLRWSAIFGGAIVAIGTWALLYSLALAIGLSSVDPQNPASLKSAGIGTGIGSIIVASIAMFVGGWTAARAARPLEKETGMLHGAVVWSLTTIVGVALVGMLMSTVIAGIAKITGGAAQSAMQTPQAQQMAQSPGMQQQAQEKAQQLQQQAPVAAARAADTTGKAFWGIFISMLLGLIAALFGATAGVDKRQSLTSGGAVQLRRPVET